MPGGVDAVRPVVLAAESNPVEAALEDLGNGEGLMDGGVFRDEGGGESGLRVKKEVL